MRRARFFCERSHSHQKRSQKKKLTIFGNTKPPSPTFWAGRLRPEPWTTPRLQISKTTPPFKDSNIHTIQHLVYFCINKNNGTNSQTCSTKGVLHSKRTHGFYHSSPTLHNGTYHQRQAARRLCQHRWCWHNTFSKVLDILTLCSKYTTALTL